MKIKSFTFWGVCRSDRKPVYLYADKHSAENQAKRGVWSVIPFMVQEKQLTGEGVEINSKNFDVFRAKTASIGHEQETEFCTECGTELVEHLIKSFDRNTGKQLKSKHCPNLNCENGCGFEGHKFSMFGHRCKRCGYVICDYY